MSDTLTTEAVESLRQLSGASPSAPAQNFDRDPLLQEREKTHGDYRRVAHLAQQLKMLFRKNAQGKDVLDPRQAESLDMIAVKLARILCGNHNEPDHWADLAGYAKLAEEACATR